MKPETICYETVKFLDGRDWMYGGDICRQLSPIVKHKESVIERHALRGRIRKDGTLETREVPNPYGRGAPVLMFRLKPKEPVTQTLL